MKKWILKFAAVLLLSGSFAFGQTGGGGTGTGGGGVRVTGTPAANDCAKFVNSNTITTAGAACGAGAGGVTSVGLTVNSTSPSGIFTVTGSPVTTSGSLNFNLAGTSGGIPYFSSSTVVSSSAALTANLPVIGGGAGVAPSVGTVTGNTTQFPTWTGAKTASRCVDTDASGNLKITIADCTTGTVTSIGLTVNGGSSSGALAITGSPITTSGTLNLGWTGANGDVMTFGASNAPMDSGTLLTALAPLASPTFTGTPAAPTAALGTNTTQLASTAFVAAATTPATNPWFPIGPISTATQGVMVAGNVAAVMGFYLDRPLTTSQVQYEIGSIADNTAATYDIGLYTGTSGGTCTRVASLGPIAGTTFAPGTTAYHTISWTQGSVTFSPGRIYTAFTSSQPTQGSIASFFGGASAANTYAYSTGVAITTGGTLPATFTCPTDGTTGATISGKTPFLKVY